MVHSLQQTCQVTSTPCAPSLSVSWMTAYTKCLHEQGLGWNLKNEWLATHLAESFTEKKDPNFLDLLQHLCPLSEIANKKNQLTEEQIEQRLFLSNQVLLHFVLRVCSHGKSHQQMYRLRTTLKKSVVLGLCGYDCKST